MLALDEFPETVHQTKGHVWFLSLYSLTTYFTTVVMVIQHHGLYESFPSFLLSLLYEYMSDFPFPERLPTPRFPQP